MAFCTKKGRKKTSVSIVVHLQIVVVKFLLGFIKLSKFLCLSFADLLPFCIMCGETLYKTMIDTNN